jgi:hypothetical protein
MMGYIENPKTKKSGVVAAIPQTGKCPNMCDHCFFQSGRSFLEPLDENLPNMPSPEVADCRVVRVNDGNDSNVQRDKVMAAVSHYRMKFYNTAIPDDLEGFDAPVVLTVNPADMTYTQAYLLKPIPKNLMFVRVRATTWTTDLIDRVVEHYSACEVPIVLTFMAFFSDAVEECVPEGHRDNYMYRKRTTNAYWAITTDAWRKVMQRYEDNKWVYSCGFEGERDTSACHRCGNCLREYFYTMERLRRDEDGKLKEGVEADDKAVAQAL